MRRRHRQRAWRALWCSPSERWRREKRPGVGRAHRQPGQVPEPAVTDFAPHVARASGVAVDAC
ncbi:hypothetical protein ACQPZQ_10655 [Pseudonocardia sp. CA-142604]|uniref:hypothetical protein n=1 Tax=Pseudonocardia sp. CA-142604 TaxID=3240024 RepID=UPI003D94C5AB